MPNDIHVLIADDNKNYTSLLRDYLSMIPDIKVIATASSGSDTIEKLRAYETDVLLLDIVMPDMDGIEILHNIKEFSELKPVIIVLSAIENKNVVDRCFSLGVFHYFIKPLNLETLVQKIRSAVRKKNADSSEQKNGTLKASQETEEKITSLLLQCGIPANILGFRFVRDIISLYIKNNSKNSTAELYNIVAQNNKTTPTRVIKSINYAVKIAWERNSYSSKSEIIKKCFVKNNVRPNNIQFICTLAGILTRN